METSLLRNQIHSYIDLADERFLALVYGMIQADQTDDDDPLTDNELKIIQERVEDHQKNSESGDTWEVVKSRLLSK